MQCEVLLSGTCREVVDELQRRCLHIAARREDGARVTCMVKSLKAALRQAGLLDMPCTLVQLAEPNSDIRAGI